MYVHTFWVVLMKFFSFMKIKRFQQCIHIHIISPFHCIYYHRLCLYYIMLSCSQESPEHFIICITKACPTSWRIHHRYRFQKSICTYYKIGTIIIPIAFNPSNVPQYSLSLTSISTSCLSCSISSSCNVA